MSLERNNNGIFSHDSVFTMAPKLSQARVPESIQNDKVYLSESTAQYEMFQSA